MEKIVKYNGRKDSFLGSTPPVDLVQGEMYTVIGSVDRRWQTDYTLRGIKGQFNSAWFTEVQCLVAFSQKPPVVGKRCECAKLKERSLELVKWSTSPVQAVMKVGDAYITKTKNSIYIIKQLSN